MKTPPRPGQGLKGDIDALGLSIAEAAVGLGITRQQLYNVVDGGSAISPDVAVRLEQAIGGTAEGWLRLQTGFDLVQARAGHRIAARTDRAEGRVTRLRLDQQDVDRLRQHAGMHRDASHVCILPARA